LARKQEAGCVKIFRSRYVRLLAGLALGGSLIAALACAGEERIVEVTRVVQQTVQVEKPVEVTKVVQQTVVVEKTTVVEKPVEVTKVVQQTVVVEKQVEKTVVVVQTATPTPIPVPKGIEQVPQPTSKSAVGTAVFAVAGPLNDQNGLCRAQACEGTHYNGIGETLFFYDIDTLKESAWVATGWKLEEDPNAKSKLAVTVTIREGIPFHKVPAPNNPSGDWGTLTAEDVAFSINDANFGTPKAGVDLLKYTTNYDQDAKDKYIFDSIHGQAGDFDVFNEVQVIDKTHVKIPFISFTSIWLADLLGQPGQAISITSKKAHNYTDGTYKNPGDFLRAFVVETGPFQVESWTRDDKLTSKSRYSGTEKHYLPELTPKIARIVQVQAPDPTSRVALLRSGDVDIAYIQPKDAPQFTKDGKSFGVTSTGGATQLGIFYSGNLWETKSAKDGSDLNPYASGGVYQADWAWIGDPRNADDMEEARQVRWAMAESINRDEVNKALLGCLGVPVHVEYVSITNPRYLVDGKTQGYDRANCTTDVTKLKWPYKYDVASARARILGDKVQGSYQKNAPATGVLKDRAFEVSIYAGPELGGGGSLTGEVVDAISGYWTELGLKTFTLKFAYQTFRPSVVNRTNTIPFVTSCDKGRETNPWFFPKGLVQTSLSRGGFSCGFESPVILDLYQKAAVEKDPVVGAQLVDQYIQYVYDQALQPGVIAVPDLFIYNTAKVKQWPMSKSMTSGTDSWWQLELQPGK
jgi:ABC-type transport system substrate-binding protein